MNLSLVDPSEGFLMRAVRRSPLLRIALLSLTVLFAHTVHAARAAANFSVARSCAAKVAAAQPDPEKKLVPGSKRIVRPGRLADCHNLFGGGFGLPGARGADLLLVSSGVPLSVASWTVDVAPQRRPFTLRI
ncbi:MAG TPA: hypothetical protein VGM11_06950 [Acidobacteriaceae bacterium]|jgi:hypothetical protein